MHWKCGIFVGQEVVEFGSANWTPFELQPASATNFKDETALFTDDLELVNAFKTNFDVFWADTTNFLDWPVAYQRETGTPWTGTVSMTIDRTRREPNNPSPSTMVWSQGTELTTRMTTEINQETTGVDIVLYRLSVPNITNALIGRVNAGVPVRVFVEPTQYPQLAMAGVLADRYTRQSAMGCGRSSQGTRASGPHAHEGPHHVALRHAGVVELHQKLATRPQLFHPVSNEDRALSNAAGRVRIGCGATR